MDKVEALDLIEDTAEIVSEEVSRKVLLAVGIIGLGWGFTFGAMAGYQFAKRRLEPKYEQRLAEEIEDTKRFYARLNDEKKGVKPSDFLETAADALERYQGLADDDGETVREPDVEINVEVKNVFTDNRPEEFDLEFEQSNRSPEIPYIIDHDEYMSAEPGFEQVSLTYYEGDDTLADDQDKHIPLVDDVVGEDNLRFGYGSGDPNTVFIRNEKMSTDFEVTKSDGKYAHEVLGLQHSAEYERMDRLRPVRKVRGGDE